MSKKEALSNPSRRRFLRTAGVATVSMSHLGGLLGETAAQFISPATGSAALTARQLSQKFLALNSVLASTIMSASQAFDRVEFDLEFNGSLPEESILESGMRRINEGREYSVDLVDSICEQKLPYYPGTYENVRQLLEEFRTERDPAGYEIIFGDWSSEEAAKKVCDVLAAGKNDIRHFIDATHTAIEDACKTMVREELEAHSHCFSDMAAARKAVWPGGDYSAGNHPHSGEWSKRIEATNENGRTTNQR